MDDSTEVEDSHASVEEMKKRALARRDRGDYAQAASMLEAVLTAQLADPRVREREVFHTRWQLARSLARAGRHQEAVELQQRLFDEAAVRTGLTSETAVRAFINLLDSLLRLGEVSEARQIGNLVIDAYLARGGKNPDETTLESLYYISSVWRQLGDPQRAYRLSRLVLRNSWRSPKGLRRVLRLLTLEALGTLALRFSIWIGKGVVDVPARGESRLAKKFSELS